MCGIAGIYNFKKGPRHDAPIRSMTDAIAHRGPDADGFLVDENVALGHRRLSIIDLSAAANQPIFDHSGRYALIFNGEIYNFREVIPLLPDYPFRTKSDSEVILAAYAKWGKSCLEHLNGMFAFALYDKADGSLFVARDRLGIKPLYWFADGERFVFSSELRSMLASGMVPRRASREGLRNYLVFQSVYAPLTILENVFQLMPGECAMVTPKGVERETYWRVERPPTNGQVFEQKAVEKKVFDLLSASVERRMIADVPLGAFLSGGIDSSAVVALMAQASEQPVDTFTIGFAEKEFDESRFASIVSKKFRTRHTEVRLSPDDFLKSLPEAMEAIDSPSGDGLNTYTVSKATKEAGLKVALSGLGGDELFAGYSYFRRFKKLRDNQLLFLLMPGMVRKPIVSAARAAFSHDRKIDRLLDIAQAPAPTIEEIYPLFRLVNLPKEANEVLGEKSFPELTIQKLLRDRHADLETLPALGQFSVAELLGYTLNVLIKDTDQFSMASALEVREPFFDYRLVEYVLRVPDELKLDRRTPKPLLVRSLGDLLPDDIVHRPKMGFAFPWKHWLLGELRPFCEKHIENLARIEAIDGQAVRRLWAEFVESRGEKCSFAIIWQMVVLSYWLEKNRVEC